MTKKHFIALADRIKFSQVKFSDEQLGVLCNWMVKENVNFNRELWMGYVKGECGPGGKGLKKDAKREV